MAAPPPDVDGAVPAAAAADPSLAERVEALERVVFGADEKAEVVEEEDLRAQSGE